MPAVHYALSEAMIVGAALWVTWRFAGMGAWLGAVGVSIFGIAAAIGVFRFATSQIDQLAMLHRTVSQAGGASAMALVALQLALPDIRQTGGWSRHFALLPVFGTLALSLCQPDLTSTLFLVWLAVAIIGVAAWPSSGLKERLLRSGVVAIMVGNLIWVRRSDALGPDLAWHMFHILVAAWLVGIWWLGQQRLKDSAETLQV